MEVQTGPDLSVARRTLYSVVSVRVVLGLCSCSFSSQSGDDDGGSVFGFSRQQQQQYRPPITVSRRFSPVHDSVGKNS